MSVDISRFDKCRVLVVGDLMIDEYLWGEVDRISPEAPVQVISVLDESFTLGGAGNVVNNLAAIGAKVFAAGVIGTGRDGQTLIRKFDELGVDTRGVIREPERPTTRKTRVIAANQHVLRIDRETKTRISDKTFATLAGFLEEIIPEIDIILVSDYNKGLITESLLSKLIRMAGNQDKIVIADPKGLDFTKYSGVTMLTPNKKEAALASGVEIEDEAGLLKAGQKIINTIGLEKLLVTCGREGMVLIEKGADPCFIRAEARQVFDVSGAGDTVLAVMGLAVASGASFEDCAALANTAAGIVVGKVGTATVTKKELAGVISHQGDEFSEKLKNLSECREIIRDLKNRNKKIVLTNGCFDFLHAGHVRLFSASKQLGDVLIVAIDDDESIKKLKGSGRPVIGERERVRILSALDMIDHIVVFSTDDLELLLETLQPDLLTKGSNYTSDEVNGREVVEQLGGRVVLIPIAENISSTDIIKNIKNGDAGV